MSRNPPWLSPLRAGGNLMAAQSNSQSALFLMENLQELATRLPFMLIGLVRRVKLYGTSLVGGLWLKCSFVATWSTSWSNLRGIPSFTRSARLRTIHVLWPPPTAHVIAVSTHPFLLIEFNLPRGLFATPSSLRARAGCLKMSQPPLLVLLPSQSVIFL